MAAGTSTTGASMNMEDTASVVIIFADTHDALDGREFSVRGPAGRPPYILDGESVANAGEIRMYDSD